MVYGLIPHLKLNWRLSIGYFSVQETPVNAVWCKEKVGRRVPKQTFQKITRTYWDIVPAGPKGCASMPDCVLFCIMVRSVSTLLKCAYQVCLHHIMPPEENWSTLWPFKTTVSKQLVGYSFILKAVKQVVNLLTNKVTFCRLGRIWTCLDRHVWSVDGWQTTCSWKYWVCHHLRYNMAVPVPSELITNYIQYIIVQQSLVNQTKPFARFGDLGATQFSEEHRLQGPILAFFLYRRRWFPKWMVDSADEAYCRVEFQWWSGCVAWCLYVFLIV